MKDLLQREVKESYRENVLQGLFKKQLLLSLAWKWAEAAEVGRNAFILLCLN